MPTVVLKDEQAADIGFLLVAGDESLENGPAIRDVIFMKLPLPSASPLAAFIGDHKHVEFSAQVESAANGCTVTFPIDPVLSFQAQIEQSGKGLWSVASVGGGACQVLKK